MFETPVARAVAEDDDNAGPIVDHHEVELAVVIEVAHRDTRRSGDRSGEVQSVIAGHRVGDTQRILHVLDQ